MRNRRQKEASTLENWQIYALLGFLGGLALGVPLVAWRLRELRLSQAGLDDLNKMTDDDMRTHMSRLLGALGYRVFLPREADSGFDLLLIDGLGQRRGVLLREWRKVIDEEVVRSVAKLTEGLTNASAMLVSVEGYSPRARQAAEETGTIIWSLTDLTQAIGRVREQAVITAELPTIRSDVSTAEFMASATLQTAASGDAGPLSQHNLGARAEVDAPARRSGDSKRRRRPERMLTKGDYIDPSGPPKCPRCGKRMVTRRSANGEYWGCATFPRCLGTRPKE